MEKPEDHTDKLLPTVFLYLILFYIVSWALWHSETFTVRVTSSKVQFWMSQRII